MTRGLEGSSGVIHPDGRSLRFLVVDDDPLNRNMMELMLAPHGYELEFATDGSEALEAIKSRPFDLVFMDLILPDMNGRDVARQVREFEAGKQHLPIVAVTAFDMPGQPLELVKAGMDDYIFKPYDFRGLSRIIQLYAVDQGQGPGNPVEPSARVLGPDAPVLDTAGTLQDFSDDVDGYKELLRDFLASLPVRFGKMEQAYTAGDYESLSRECHTLKGVSAGLGAMRLSRLATQLGRSCADGHRHSAESLLRELDEALAQVRAEAATFLER